MCILTMKNMTQAMKARAALESRGIRGEIVSLDPSLTRNGCAYGIRLPCAQTEDAMRQLEAKKIPWGTVIGAES